MAEMDLLGALLRGGVSALAVAVLLLAAHRWGRDMAGLLAGLPTVTGPAVVWLALDQGHGFAAQAAYGAVAAGVPCALFALTYARVAAMRGRLAALACACAACLLGLPFVAAQDLSMPMTLAAVALMAAACLAWMPRVTPRAVAQGPRLAALLAGATTVLVSGAVSALASLAAPALDPHWAGALTSPPLLAAAVALELHRHGCPAPVQDFLRGYTAGLVGRSLFVAAFGALLTPQGLVVALVASVVVALLMGASTLAWMRWRSQRHGAVQPAP